MATYAPREITSKILNLCNEINPNELPVWVPIRTMKNALPSECFPNVENKIKKDGGEIQYGWAIWEWENVMIEAEFHAVWRSPEGRLICVSPHEYDDRICFLPDNSKVFNRIDRVDNIRKSLRSEPIVDEFIKVCIALYAEKERLTKGQFDVVKMQITPELRDLARQHQALLNDIQKLPPLPKPNSECFCGSGKRYRECCQH